MTIEFMHNVHESSYFDLLHIMKSTGCIHRSLAYLLSLDKVCRCHVTEIFDFEEDCIKLHCLGAGWQTPSSRRTICLAFNLWNGCCYDEHDNISFLFTVDSIFSGCNCYNPYYLTAIKLRYCPFD